MEYTVQKLAQVAGVSARTLRYYDQIGLLSPARVSTSGYRIYGRDQVDRLQQILLYREMGLELSAIARILDAPGFDVDSALSGHLRRLREQRMRLDLLIDSVEHTMQSREEGTHMSDEQKFEGFKKVLVDENEQRYGAEVREKYGDRAADESNARMMNLTKQQYDGMQAVSDELQRLLERAVKGGESPEGEAGEKAAALHKRWLSYTWGQYSPEAHRGLAQMYIDDERFAAHYDKNQSGCAKFLRDAVVWHAK